MDDGSRHRFKEGFPNGFKDVIAAQQRMELHKWQIPGDA
jgi:hypothetical protein